MYYKVIIRVPNFLCGFSEFDESLMVLMSQLLELPRTCDKNFYITL